ncbi:EamA family transporter [Asanoa iriomotensis]|uniref:Membrane protein n=1 Tax=Asanoa iriomotensis TaxID=234613 RepID=A0ABQ4BWC7_9ACTN|nr:EamA family transporter [Asanoa iriomotensis]GIF54845.1 membrane protein [Asanoa iriomotensis]
MSPWAGPAAVVAVLAAAVLHASWNALVKATGDQVGIFGRSGLIGLAMCAVGIWFVDPPAAGAWGWLIASVVIHVGYNLGLLAAYRLGDFNQTYPLARGLGPVVVAVVAALALDEPLSPLPAVGVLVIAGAIGVLGLTPWRKVKANRPAVLAAIFTGVTIASYTLVDGVGVRSSGSAAGYTLWLLGLQSAVTAVLALGLRRDTRLLAAGGRAWSAAAAVAVLSTLAYGLVLWAQTRGALAAVAALRESSVVVAAVIGMLAFKEPMGRVRIAASIAVALGVALLAVPAA